MTDEKGETWSPSGMSKVESRPDDDVACISANESLGQGERNLSCCWLALRARYAMVTVVGPSSVV